MFVSTVCTLYTPQLCSVLLKLWYFCCSLYLQWLVCVSVQSEQVLQLSAFIEAELVYHQQSVDILQALLDSLKKKYISFITLVLDQELISSMAQGCSYTC